MELADPSEVWKPKYPVCGKVITDRYTDYIEHTLCEEEESCSDHYHFRFAYGGYETYINGVDWHYSYTETEEENRTRHKEQEFVIQANCMFRADDCSYFN